MADAKITALTALAAATTDDILPIVDDPGGSPVTKKITVAALFTSRSLATPTVTGALTLTGGQIAFPATQSTSADANTLDDYEQGTWTPAFSYTTAGTSSWASVSSVGFYTKIGNLVGWSFYFTGVPTNGTASGSLQVTGLPFNAVDITQNYPVGALTMQGWTKANYTSPTVVVYQNTTTARFNLVGSGQPLAEMAVADVPSGGTIIARASGIYYTL
jgi:hypothetical protein